MNIALIVPFADYCFSQDPPCLGAGCLSGYMRSLGHDAHVYPVARQNLHTLDGITAEMVGISILEDSWELAQVIARDFRDRGARLIAGGVFASNSPHEVLDSGLFDAVCIGDGELPLAAFVDQVAGGTRVNGPGLMWREGSGASCSPHTDYHVLDDLSRITQVDYSYKSFAPIKTYPANSRQVLRPPSGDEEGATCEFMFARGCCFRCTYCHNSNEAVQGTQWLRHYDLEMMLEQIQRVHGRRRLSRLCILDDDIVANARYFARFYEEYASRLRIPYRAFARPERINDGNLEMLTESGCYLISLGMESANNRIREQVLNRKMKNEQIEFAIRKCQEAGIQVILNVMIGIPEETEREVGETIDFVSRNPPDFIFASIFTPYRGTRIYKECLDQGWRLDQVNQGGVQTGRSRNPYFAGKEAFLLSSLNTLHAQARIQPMVSACTRT